MLIDDSPDHYESYYAERLWAMLPEVYRAEDSLTFDDVGPLREMVDRIGAQAAILRRSIDRLWDDQSIESCDDYLIPYIGDLLATNIVAGLGARGQRKDVAKTIYYRRRKGTVGVLEEIAVDITGWEARVVEMFRRLGRTRHNFDPPVGGDSAVLLQAEQLTGKWTRSLAGGTADLRNAYGASRSQTAFDEFSHTADLRRGRGLTGWHSIPRLGVFLYRLYAFPLGPVTPVADAKCKNKFTFDPTGRLRPLFSADSRPAGDNWVSLDEWQIPGPLPGSLLADKPGDAPARNHPGPPPYLDKIYGTQPHSFGIYEKHGTFTDLVAPGGLSFEPEDGLFYYPKGSTPSPLATYHYGFASEIGAGPFDRRRRGTLTETLMGETTAANGGTLPAAPLTGTLTIADSLTYAVATANKDVLGVEKLLIRSSNTQRPLVRQPSGFQWRFAGANDTATLVLEGVFVSGGEVVIDRKFDTVRLTCCTLDPGSLAPDGTMEIAIDGVTLAPCVLTITGSVRRLILDRCITGPIRVTGMVEQMEATDSIVQSVDGSDAIHAPDTRIDLSRCTILGKVTADRMDASECILNGTVTVRNTQQGCVRFTAWAADSVLPNKYESVAIAPGLCLFNSRCFGSPAYGQLKPDVCSAISEGAQNGSEMGAFCYEQYAIKMRGLRIKFEEYMPLGLSPAFITVT